MHATGKPGVPRRDARELRAAALRRILLCGHASARRMRRSPPRRLNLALQGGGAHGAFTWGVLDRLLDHGRLEIDGISGTSAGAMNAVVLASGWLGGGRDGAREALAELWRQVADLARLSPLRQGRLSHLALDLTAQLLSPYQLNPLGINPLRGLLERLVDFERLRRDRRVQLFLAATNLRTGNARVFSSSEITPDVVLASACLPEVHHAVEIDGEAYWDGGYASNPPIVALVEGCAARDLLLVQINALAREVLPTAAGGIRNRVGEIVFGRPLAEELRRLELEARAARSPFRLFDRRRRRLARHRLHRIDGSAALGRLDPETKLVPDWSTLVSMRDLGRNAADAWLAGGTATCPAHASAAPAGDATGGMRRSA